MLAIIAFPSLIYPGTGCEVVTVSLYDSGSSYCATVTIKNTAGGERLTGKIIAMFIDGQTKSKSFEGRVDNGQVTTTNICWGRKSQIESMGCEFWTP